MCTTTFFSVLCDRGIRISHSQLVFYLVTEVETCERDTEIKEKLKRKRLKTKDGRGSSASLHSSCTHTHSPTGSLIFVFILGELRSPQATILLLTSVLSDPAACLTLLPERLPFLPPSFPSTLGMWRM